MTINSLIFKIIPIFYLSWYLLDIVQAFCHIIKSSRFLRDIFCKLGLLCLSNKYQTFLEVYFLNQNIRAAKYIPVFRSFYASTDVA